MKMIFFFFWLKHFNDSFKVFEEFGWNNQVQSEFKNFQKQRFLTTVQLQFLIDFVFLFNGIVGINKKNK